MINSNKESIADILMSIDEGILVFMKSLTLHGILND